MYVFNTFQNLRILMKPIRQVIDSKILTVWTYDYVLRYAEIIKKLLEETKYITTHSSSFYIRHQRIRYCTKIKKIKYQRHDL
jgi:hypothetical protein